MLNSQMVDMGGSIHGVTHKWMVYNGKYQINMDENWGTPISGNPHMALYNEHDLDILILSYMIVGYLPNIRSSWFSIQFTLYLVYIYNITI